MIEKKATLREIFTTGQVAKITHVAPRTVSKWFDKGLLEGYCVPGSSDRRIPRANLITFLQKHKMPLDGIEIEDRQYQDQIAAKEAAKDAKAKAIA